MHTVDTVHIHPSSLHIIMSASSHSLAENVFDVLDVIKNPIEPGSRHCNGRSEQNWTSGGLHFTAMLLDNNKGSCSNSTLVEFSEHYACGSIYQSFYEKNSFCNAKNGTHKNR